MSTLVCNSPLMIKGRVRPSTPISHRCSTAKQFNRLDNIHVQLTLLDLIEQLKYSTDSSTQLLIRLYQHKALRLSDQPEKLQLFQAEIISGLQRLHPSIVQTSLTQVRNQFTLHPEPIVMCRSAQATIRKLH